MKVVLFRRKKDSAQDLDSLKGNLKMIAMKITFMWTMTLNWE